MAQQTQQLGKTTVVIGGGMAGLVAARTLADYYTEVLVLERDTLPASAEPRKGVPQARHAHALLAGGQQALEKLFPGLRQHLVDLGAARGYGRFFSGGGYHCQIRSGLQGLFVSRPFLEAEVRARLLTLPNVRVVENCDVLGLVANEDRARVTGVRAMRRLTTSTEDTISADLVVDASGRGSRTPAWLETLGYAKPDVELVEVHMGYATRLYRRQPEHFHGDLYVNVAPTPENRRACGMFAQERDRWIVALAGYCGDYPPTDEHGFLTFARSLPTPDVYEVIRRATPLSDPVPFRFSANQRRHYEKLTRFPDGLLVLGDAICSFTPIYGQGMTVAAFEALALQQCLAAGTQKLAQRFFTQASKVVDIPWSMTVGNDRCVTKTEKAPTPITRFLNWYMGRLQIAARHDPAVAFAFRQVGNLLATPPSLLHPRIALRVLWGNIRGSRHGQRGTARQETVSQPSH
jgi:2-polyprenyl-6-methoxyphenol hydroxylase-like FAD-dependent oxidoreductase